MNKDPSVLTVTRSICPLCGKELLTNWVPDDIPFFGEVMHITSQCDCGFRYSDTLILAQREPVRYEIKIENMDDLDARVVRSTSGTIRIPELCIDIEPGPASESFISNIEGVFDRVKEILNTVVRWNEEEKVDRANELLARLDKIMNGEEVVNVIIEDPMGNSAIVSEKARSRTLTQQEVSRLKTGMVVFEMDDKEV